MELAARLLRLRALVGGKVATSLSPDVALFVLDWIVLAVPAPRSSLAAVLFWNYRYVPARSDTFYQSKQRLLFRSI